MQGISITSFLPFILTSIPFQIINSIFALSIPFMILNSIIAKKKGKKTEKYFLLSIIPALGLCLAIYLNSFVDKELEGKINEIYKKLMSDEK
jgi:hypothetical protein